jgi:hypothetical protein
MSLYDRVFLTEGLQRERRQGKVTLGQLPPEQQAKPRILPTTRQRFPGNWPRPVRQPGETVDPKLRYKIASHQQRSMFSPGSAGAGLGYREPEKMATQTFPPIKTKALKRQELLDKRKLLQTMLKRRNQD